MRIKVAKYLTYYNVQLSSSHRGRLSEARDRQEIFQGQGQDQNSGS